MGKSAIIEKISKRLRNDISSEDQVLFILTRIGKILEFDKKKQKYPIINFYRNWSVHTQIDNTKSIINHILPLIQDKNKIHQLLFHEPLRSELNNFFEEYSIPTLNAKQYDNFSFYLSKIISDTPIKFTPVTSVYTFSVSEPPNIKQSGTYKLAVDVKVEPINLKVRVNSVSASTK